MELRLIQHVDLSAEKQFLNVGRRMECGAERFKYAVIVGDIVALNM